jgi:quercetin dioxygenase-like cupin family protein
MLGAFSMLLGAVATAKGAGTSQAIPDAVFSLAQAKTTKTDFGEESIYFEGRTDQLKAIVTGSLLLKPGREPHPPHQHPEEEILLIGEGAGEILVNGKTNPVGPGALLYCEANHVHGIKNTGSKPLRFYFFKWQA